MLFLIDILVLGTVFSIAWAISRTLQPSPKSVLKLNTELSNDFNETISISGRTIKRPPLFKMLGFLIPVNKIIVDKLGREKLENRLLAAKFRLSPEDFIIVKEVLLAISLSCFAFFKNFFINNLPLFILLLAISLMGPELWLVMRISKRKKLMIKVLPDVIDLLTLCVNAGLDFGLAVKWVVEKSRPNPLIEELNMFLLETKVGQSRRKALQDMAKRVNAPEMHSFVRTLVQAERLGTPVESALSILAEDVRELRFRRGEQLALKAPLKMLLPLIFFIMPVVIIIVGGPIVLQFLKGGMPTFK